MLTRRLAASSLLVAGLAAADEQAILDALSPEALERHAREIVKHRRDGGSPGEHAAVDYVVRTLRADGVPVEVHEFRAYVSDPGDCRIRIEGASPAEPLCRTQALAAPTPESGVVGDVVFVGEGRAEDYDGVDVRGKIALIDALPLPWGVKTAEANGATGAIFISYSELIQELTVSPIWGTPTHRNYRELPAIPSVNVKKQDGDALREAAASGTVRARLDTTVETGWKTLRLPVATIESPVDPEGFVLVGGHIDGWHFGAVDEGASNAAMVEMARIFHGRRSELSRSLKVAFWPAHSNGRYAGSAWFVDHAWLELERHALAYMNIDGVGQIGATRYGSANTAAMDDLARAVLRDVAGAEPTPARPGRNSDQGFYGVGLPLLQFNHGREDFGGRYWFWHTTEDTFDKIDFDVLAGDTKLYLAGLWRLLAPAVPPLRIEAEVAEIESRLQERQDRYGRHLDLTRLVAAANELRREAVSLDAKLALTGASGWSPEATRELVSVLRPISRVTYQESGPFHQDPALAVPALPGLAALQKLNELRPESDEYGFTRTHLVRERNRVEHALGRSLEAARRLSRRLSRR